MREKGGLLQWERFTIACLDLVACGCYATQPQAVGVKAGGVVDWPIVVDNFLNEFYNCLMET